LRRDKSTREDQVSCGAPSRGNSCLTRRREICNNVTRRERHRHNSSAARSVHPRGVPKWPLPRPLAGRVTAQQLGLLSGGQARMKAREMESRGKVGLRLHDDPTTNRAAVPSLFLPVPHIFFYHFVTLSSLHPYNSRQNYSRYRFPEILCLLS